jgi:hypothetical protein
MISNKFISPVIIFACALLLTGFISFLRILILPSANNQIIYKEYPMGSVDSIDVDDNGNIYCANSYYGSVQVYDNNGIFIYTLRIDSDGGGFRIKLMNNKLVVATVRNQKVYTFLLGKLIDEKKDKEKYFTFLNESKRQIIDGKGNKYKISNLQLILPQITIEKPDGEKVLIRNNSYFDWILMAPLPAILFITLGIIIILSKKLNNR